jgi:gentisate 1,2-dioxygenase
MQWWVCELPFEFVGIETDEVVVLARQMFCVLAGTVQATVNNSTFEAKPGDQFLVPRGGFAKTFCLLA